jgi:hypothetical protein
MISIPEKEISGFDSGDEIDARGVDVRNAL